MMTTTIDPLRDRLAAALLKLEARSLRRDLRVVESRGRVVRHAGRSLVNLASNDYLALAQHPRLQRAAIDAIERFGVGGGASRLIAGHSPQIEALEARFAAFKHAEAALLFATGYTANLAVLLTLAQKHDTILIDKLTHASLIDAAQASDARLRTYRHLDYTHLEDRLKAARARQPANTSVFIVTDSIFSMDGDAADLAVICDLAARYGAATVVDEAHATGILGPHGEGLAAQQGVAERIDITVSTASKALGSLGGIVTASRAVIDTLVNRARPFIYTTAPPPPQVAAIDAALDVIRDEPHRRARLHDLTAQAQARPWPSAALAGISPPGSPPGISPILPLVTGSAESALALAAHLASHGFLAVAVRPPTVAPGSARVRLSLRADLEDADLDNLRAAITAYAAG